MKRLSQIFIFSFIFLFGFQRIVDNESICGGIGIDENDCVYSAHSINAHEENHKTEKHVCINCPCNYILISFSNLFLNKIYTEISQSYTITKFFVATNFDYLHSLIRPPKIFT